MPRPPPQPPTLPGVLVSMADQVAAVSDTICLRSGRCVFGIILWVDVLCQRAALLARPVTVRNLRNDARNLPR